MDLSLHLFGIPRLLRGGRTVEMPLKRGWGLLAYLAVTARPQPRETLAVLLWPEADGAEGRARLRRTLHRVTRAVDAPLVIAAGDTLRLNPDLGLRVDVQRYRAHVEASTAAEGAPSRDRDALTQAAALYRADFLEGFAIPDSDAFEEWQFFQAEDLRRSLARVLARLARRCLEVGEHGAALDYAGRLLTIDPLHEPSHRLLMTVYAAAGEPTEAARQFQACRALLAAELGVEPEAETIRLHESIRGGHAATPAAMAAPATRYVRSGDVHIAYQMLGETGPHLVLVPGFISHLEKFWEAPGLARFVRALAARTRLILMDRRGVGLSDRVGYAPTLEHTADDILAVMDAAGAPSASVFAISEGGPSAVLLAAMRPERVHALILWGTTAKATRSDDFRPGIPRPLFARWIEGLVAGWGGPSAIEVFAPTVAADPATRQWWAGLLRSGSSPGGISRVLEAFMDTDVRALLPAVRAPTLVLHHSDDQMFRIDTARYLARHIPGARLVEIDGRDHWFWTENPDAVLKRTTEFLGALDTPDTTLEA